MLAKIKEFVNPLAGIITHKIKRWQKNILLATALFLIISLSFSSGVIIGGKLFKRPPLIIEKDLLINATEITVANSNDNDFQYVASSKGKYYYPIDCPLAKNLSDKNKIFFSSKEEAEKQGYIFNTKCEP
ncbi:MAG: hypothetical protein QG648_316 [Patescibacteria group bacterium]|nr:hypothetical protein [Patescibacteria group bacterium]